MDHFPIVQALARAALANPSDAVRRQVDRLREVLESTGETDQARALARLLSAGEKSEHMAPSRLVRSSMTIAGEDLTRRTPVPVDKESANPLAAVVFPDALPERPPVLDPPMQEAIRVLIEEWTNLDVLESAGVTPSRSCLIYGAPGTGKTHLALWIAGQVGLPVVVAKLDGLISSFLGTTARNIAAMFSFAQRYRCVLLLDEFDAIAKLRDDPQEVGEIKRVVNALLQNLDLRRDGGLTIGVTNHENLLDPAIWRRFETQLAIPRPSFDSRLAVAVRHGEGLSLAPNTLRFIAWLSAGTTGAEIELLMKSMRKRIALTPAYRESSVLDATRDFMALHSGRLSSERRELVQGQPEDLANALWKDPEVTLDQAAIAEVLGKDRTTVNRWLNKRS